MNLLIFFTSYILVILSVFGYSLALQKFQKKTNLEFEYNFLGSIFFLIVISLFTHFFFKHGYLHNLIILLIGISLFLFFLKKFKNLIKNYSKYFFLIFFTFVFAILSFKTHDDFPYYHFPYTFYLTQENLIIGVGNLNHGFRTPSSIFYLNSLFYLPIIKYFLFNIGQILIFGASNLILIFKLKNDFRNKDYDFILILSLLSFIFINIFFYRLSEHGTDRSAQILILILFIEILTLIVRSVSLKSFFSKIFILLGIIISLKAFYVLYLIIFIPIFYVILKNNFKQNLKDFLSNLYFYFFLCSGFFLILLNIFNSGCVLYPVSFTCFSFFDWSLFDEAQRMNDWYEQWAKAGATPNFRVENAEDYIKGFNWVVNWIDLYFFNKVSDFLLGLLFLIVSVFFTLNSKNEKKFKTDKKIWIVYLIILILFFEWFYNHPSLRYGGYSLVALMIFIPGSLYISRNITKKNLKNKLLFLVLLSLVVFTGRNFYRIYSEAKKYDYQFITNPNFKIDEGHFRIDYFIQNLIKHHNKCQVDKQIICKELEGTYIEKKYQYYILKNKLN